MVHSGNCFSLTATSRLSDVVVLSPLLGGDRSDARTTFVALGSPRPTGVSAHPSPDVQLELRGSGHLDGRGDALKGLPVLMRDRGGQGEAGQERGGHAGHEAKKLK